MTARAGLTPFPTAMEAFRERTFFGSVGDVLQPERALNIQYVLCARLQSPVKVNAVQIPFFMKSKFVSARANWLGATLFAASVALSGCGGGGGSNGPNLVTATPKPQPTSDQTGTGGNCTNSTYTPNYASNVRLLRWPLFPLRIYFVRDANYSAARQTLAIEGFNRWVTATGSNGFTYNVVSSEAAANVTVDFYDFQGGPGDVLGTTEVSYFDESRTIDSADISLGITGDRTNDLLTATHEMGHCLGIFGHSPNRTDLMFFEGNEIAGGAITPLDLNTVLTAYCGKFNKNVNTRTAPHRGDLETVTLH